MAHDAAYARPMRLAVVETSKFGGLLHYAAQLADGLAGRGHDVDLIAPRGNEVCGSASRAHMRAVLTPHVRSSQRLPPRNPVLYQGRRVVIATRLVRSYARIVYELSRRGYDAAILQWDLWWFGGQFAQRALGRVRNRPFTALVVHNVRPFNRWSGDDLYLSDRTTARMRRAARGIDLVFVHGERSLEEFRRTWPPIPVALIPHGDERLFASEPPPPSAEERILFFGDWRKVKGMPVLMEAFDELAARRPSVRLTIAGTPAPADFDDALVREWASGHGDRVELVDRYVPIEDVPPLFARARVVATPYLAGFQSGVVHLAQTLGRAVVASDIGDLPAAVRDGEGGLVVPPGDARALAGALERVVSDERLATDFGAAARRFAQEHANWETVAAEVEAALRRQMQRPSEAAR
jgi:glycosyltransferase involved in cell wall biosynthesis